VATDSADIVESVREEIGLDAYHMYPGSRRAIPDAVLWGFASACLLEFVKGFVDFKSLGEAIRGQLEGLLRHWRDEQDFEDYVRSEGLDRAVLAATAAIPGQITSVQRSSGIRALEDALVEIGLPRETASKHANRIDEIVMSSR
jgi:hypothetical protein